MASGGWSAAVAAAAVIVPEVAHTITTIATTDVACRVDDLRLTVETAVEEEAAVD